jgi:hypothetical protein
MSTAQDAPKITQATITRSDPRAGEYQAVVTATFDTGGVEEVLRYFDDELTFTESEFVGLTMKGVVALFMEKDRVYIQS